VPVNAGTCAIRDARDTPGIVWKPSRLMKEALVEAMRFLSRPAIALLFWIVRWNLIQNSNWNLAPTRRIAILRILLLCFLTLAAQALRMRPRGSRVPVAVVIGFSALQTAYSHAGVTATTSLVDIASTTPRPPMRLLDRSHPTPMQYLSMSAAAVCLRERALAVTNTCIRSSPMGRCVHAFLATRPTWRTNCCSISWSCCWFSARQHHRTQASG